MSNTVTKASPDGRATASIARMEPVQLECFTDKTLRFIRRAMENPEYREKIQKRAEEIRALGLYT